MIRLGINWANYMPFYNYLLLLIFLILMYQFVKKLQQRQLLVNDKYVSFMLRNYSLSRYIIKYALILLTFVFMILALFRPQWGKQQQMISQHGRDLLIAIDISRSMLAQDVTPNRLQFAKDKIKKLLYNLSCERVGLMVFSSTTILQCPLTTDYKAFFLFLEQLDVDTISQGSTAIDGAIKAAFDVFNSIADRKTKLLVVFTDGEDFSLNLDGVKQRAIEDNLSIFTMGVGTAHGAPIPVLNDKNMQIGWEKDEQGAVIMSRLNQSLLTDIAQQSGGKYIHTQQGDEDIALLIQLINKFEKDTLEDKSIHALQEQYPYFVVLAFICYVLEWIL